MVFFCAVAVAAEKPGELVIPGPAAKVDPFIGTGQGPGGSINLFPGATLPFGMVQLSPDTEDHGYGYHYDQHDIHGFSMTHMSGPGCANEGDVFFMATSGTWGDEVKDFESPYSHGDESASPGYYQVYLSRWDVNAELTATDRTGVARFMFPADKEADFIVPISHTLNSTQAAHVEIDGQQEISGYVENQVFCGNKQTYRVYFVMKFNRPFSASSVWHGNLQARSSGPAPPHGPATPPRVIVQWVPETTESPRPESETQTKPDQVIGAQVSWPASDQPQTITVRIGISYVDLAGAENNLKTEAEGKSFGDVRREAEAAWNKELSVIDVSGGSARAAKVFYTALYHSLLMPSIFSDADGRYIGFDDKIHHVAPGHLIYANFSGWDIYRSEMPLLALIEPQRMEDMCQSIVAMYEQGGWIDRWPQINRYTNVMAGSPLSIVLATAWLDGLHGFDMKTAWKGMVQDATEEPPPGKPYTGEANMDWINRIHYVPNDKEPYGSVSQIQEDSMAYAALAQLGRRLTLHDLSRHDNEIAPHSLLKRETSFFYRRSRDYRNVFNHKTHFFRPRNSDGAWDPNFDPAKDCSWRPDGCGFIEGSGWHYEWFAPWDMHWLIHAVGKRRFNKWLTQFFNYQKPAWNGRFYNPYNETDLEAPFEFNFSGKPWETQRVVRRVLEENYTTAPDGIPGNDDCGEMSSWAVMTMMGIYSIDPPSLSYEWVAPFFRKVVIHLEAPYTGKTFTIKTVGDPQTEPYIRSVKLNGCADSLNWIPFSAMKTGGEADFELGRAPDKAWANKKKDAPPSLTKKYHFHSGRATCLMAPKQLQ